MSLVAPYAARRAVIDPAWSFVRGTRMFQPNSGLVSNHDSCSRRATVAPTTGRVGNSTLADFIVAATEPSVVVWVRWVIVVPRSVRATGVSGSRPAASRSTRLRARDSGVPSTTTVTSAPVERAQSTLVLSPETTCSVGDDADVSGTPAYVGTALTALTPGTTSKPMQALRQARASSARPLKVAGSPSMRRTTRPA